MPQTRADTLLPPIGVSGAYRVNITADPIGLEGGINPFVYVENNPVNLSDALGLSSSKCCNNDYLTCLSNCIRKYDPLNPVSEIGLSTLGGTFWKSWIGLPRGFAGASPVTTVPSASVFFTGGGPAGTIGALVRGVGRVFSPIWIGYGVYLFGMEVHCAAACAGYNCAY
ncbi:MAG: hypothetical protein A4E62_00121 [Syntrophorhabdus sp. PtaU1.Bin002]|nr:MAG: hypothetical protein A4E62_00121 [Syntrophorhabdus sp. PtaU1.Bin002]